MRILFLLFVVLPIAEIYLLIKVGSVIGPAITIALVLLTAFIGAGLLRVQGYATLTRARNKMNEGALPAHEMVEGIFLAVGGALLLTPGFITDAIGFCCLIPGLRHYLIVWGSKNLKLNTMQIHSHSYRGGFSDTSGTKTDREPRQQGKNTIIDGEFERDD